MKEPSWKYSDEFLKDDCDNFSLAAHLIDQHKLYNRSDLDAYNFVQSKNRIYPTLSFMYE